MLNKYFTPTRELNMKNTFKLLAFASITLVSCHKANRTTSFMNNATITGYNLSANMCGAKYLLVIHGIADSGAQFDSLPTSSRLTIDSTAFPINIQINWHANHFNSCDTIVHRITIDSVDR